MMRRPIRKFDVAIYNKDVCSKVVEGGRHGFLDDSWADVRYLEFEAEDEAEVRAKLQRRYPAEQGFVVEAVQEQKF